MIAAVMILVVLCAVCAWKWYKWRLLAETVSSFLDQTKDPPTQEELEDRMREVIRRRRWEKCRK